MENGNSPGEDPDAWRDNPPIPHSISTGQAMNNGRLWAAVQLQLPGTSVTVMMDPLKARQLGESLVTIGDADQTMLPPRPQLIVPGSG